MLYHSCVSKQKRGVHRMKLPFCRTALLAAALGVCLVGCKPAATDEPAAFATAETAEVAATLTPTAATTA